VLARKLQISKYFLIKKIVYLCARFLDWANGIALAINLLILSKGYDKEGTCCPLFY
jgi:hypothetical protein